MKNVTKKEKKVFTKNEVKDIIRKDYDPLKVNYKNKIIYEREGQCMKEVKNIISEDEMNQLIISKKDVKEKFNNRKIISKNEYEKYLRTK